MQEMQKDNISSTHLVKGGSKSVFIYSSIKLILLTNWGSGTTCKHSIDILSPYTVVMANNGATLAFIQSCVSGHPTNASPLFTLCSSALACTSWEKISGSLGAKLSTMFISQMLTSLICCLVQGRKCRVGAPFPVRTARESKP